MASGAPSLFLAFCFIKARQRHRLFIPFNLRPRHWLDLLMLDVTQPTRFLVWSPFVRTESLVRLFVVRSEVKQRSLVGFRLPWSDRSV